MEPCPGDWGSQGSSDGHLGPGASWEARGRGTSGGEWPGGDGSAHRHVGEKFERRVAVSVVPGRERVADLVPGMRESTGAEGGADGKQAARRAEI